MTGKFLDKTSEVIGINDNLIFRKKFDIDNYHYRYENDTISFSLDFISRPGTGIDSKNDCENYDAILSIRNIGDTDIKFPDEIILNLFDYEPSFIKLAANTNWSRDWRESDQDYNTRLSEYLTQNNVGGIFGNKKNKKEKKN